MFLLIVSLKGVRKHIRNTTNFINKRGNTHESKTTIIKTFKYDYLSKKQRVRLEQILSSKLQTIAFEGCFQI